MVSQREFLTKPWSCAVGRTVPPTLCGGQEPTRVVLLVYQSSVRLVCLSQHSRQRFPMDKLVPPPLAPSVRREAMSYALRAVVPIMRPSSGSRRTR